ncbi:MAG: hypothetical protein QM726_18990 [Chitinophagaceae bacterium]
MKLRLVSFMRPLVLFSVLLATGELAIAQKNTKPAPIVVDKNKITYNADSLGNRVPDFSYCGYMASEKAIPEAPVKVVVPVASGDATLRIQSALDYAAGLPLDANGFRGAVLLQKGNYEVSGQLRITASGVVLRGSGAGDNGTIIIGASTGRLALIKIVGKKESG